MPLARIGVLAVADTPQTTTPTMAEQIEAVKEAQIDAYMMCRYERAATLAAAAETLRANDRTGWVCGAGSNLA